jgi:hypothetical protein
MPSIKHAIVAFALLTGTTLAAGAQAQAPANTGEITSGGPGTNLPPDTGSSSGTGIDRGAEDNLSGGGNRISTGGSTTGSSGSGMGSSTTGGSAIGGPVAGGTTPSNSEIGTGAAGSSVAGRPTSPGNSATPAR